MSGFDLRWLALREGADHRSRSVALAAALRAWLGLRPSPACLVDLGCGAGSGLRYLAPRLGGPQRWIGVDDDEALLRVFARTTHAGITIEARRANLAQGLAALDDIAPQAFVASALLDLVSRRWLHALLARARRCDAAVLFSLSYDGRIEAYPPHPADAAVREAFNAHQRRDKGFGPALGPRSCEAAALALASCGYEVRRETTDWRLDASSPQDAALMMPLLDGLAGAAGEQAPTRSAAIAAWRAERRGQCAAGTLRLAVGHEDTLGLPGPRYPRQ